MFVLGSVILNSLGKTIERLPHISEESLQNLTSKTEISKKSDQIYTDNVTKEAYLNKNEIGLTNEKLNMGRDESEMQKSNATKIKSIKKDENQRIGYIEAEHFSTG